MTVGPAGPTRSRRGAPGAHVFVLSPARLTGARGRRILAGEARAARIAPLRRGERVPLAEVYASISTLYFRGKMAYARHFGGCHRGEAALIITPDRGLVSADTPVGLSELRSASKVDIRDDQPRYREPLLASALALRSTLGPEDRVILLGSLATSKYVGPLSEALPDHLCAPTAFAGLGEMQRGSLLIRAVEADRELAYAPIERSAPRRPAARPARA